MTTSVDIRILVAVACILLIFAGCLAAFLRGAWTERFRHAANLFAASLAALILSAVGVFLSQDAPFVLTAVFIITGAHFGIVFAYLSLYVSVRPHPAERSVLIGAAVLCLGHWLLAVLFQSAAMLIISTSVVNSVVGFVAAASLWSMATTASRRNRILVTAPFFLIGCAYGVRLLLLATFDPAQWFVLASSVIAFVLSASSLYLGFALIIIRESALSDDLRRARAQSDEILRQRTRFFSQINHELRTPLNGIVGLTRVLSGHVAGEAGAKTLRDLQSSAALLKTVVDDVLNFAKLDNGAVELEVIPFHLPDLVDGLAAQYRAMAAEKAVVLRVSSAPGLAAWRRGDPTRLGQILHNILANAVKFTAEGEISVSTATTEPDQIRISVIDTGIGMSEDQVRHLFEPFRQATAGTTRQFGGTGLGMSIVKMLVEAMDGRVEVQSTPDSGTRVDVILPMDATDAPLRTESGPATTALPHSPSPAPTPSPAPAIVPAFAGPDGMRILCVDDDEINRLVLEAFLIELGITPVMAESGAAAIALAQGDRFDIYLIDINMPDMGGVETLHELRRIDAARQGQLPLAVAVTANVMADDIRSYLASGFDEHLPKPIVFDDLSDLLHRAQNRQSPNSDLRAASA